MEQHKFSTKWALLYPRVQGQTFWVDNERETDENVIMNGSGQGVVAPSVPLAGCHIDHQDMPCSHVKDVGGPFERLITTLMIT